MVAVQHPCQPTSLGLTDDEAQWRHAALVDPFLEVRGGGFLQLYEGEGCVSTAKHGGVVLVGMKELWLASRTAGLTALVDAVAAAPTRETEVVLPGYTVEPNPVVRVANPLRLQFSCDQTVAS